MLSGYATTAAGELCAKLQERFKEDLAKAFDRTIGDTLASLNACAPQEVHAEKRRFFTSQVMSRDDCDAMLIDGVVNTREEAERDARESFGDGWVGDDEAVLIYEIHSVVVSKRSSPPPDDRTETIPVEKAMASRDADMPW